MPVTAGLSNWPPLVERHWQPWQHETHDLVSAMFGAQMAVDFADAGVLADTNIQAWAESQADWLDALLSSDDLPLMGDWRP